MLKEQIPFQSNGYTLFELRFTGRQITRLKSRVPLLIVLAALMLTCCGKGKVKEADEAEPPASVQGIT